MSGLKGMRGNGLGGARAGAGRKKKNSEAQHHLCESGSQSFELLSTKLRSVKERAVAQCISNLDCDSKTLKALYEAGLLPKSFYNLETTVTSLENKIATVALLPTVTQAMLALVSDNINKIAN